MFSFKRGVLDARATSASQRYLPTGKAIFILLAVLAGCDNDKKLDLTPPPTSNPAGTGSGSTSIPLTGALDEASFKALHELRGDKAPKPRGTMVDLSTSKAYLSLPEVGMAPFPGVVVIHEWWGLNDHIKHWADRLANDGYAALAVDLYGGKVADNPDDAMSMMKEVDQKAARQVLLDGYNFLGDDARIKAEKRGVIGWCFGGKWSLELAMDAPKMDATVVYYGQVENDPVRLADLHGKLLAIFANRDKGIQPQMVDHFEFSLGEAGKKGSFTVRRFDAEHAFANPSGPAYDEKAASAAWDETRAFLAKNLKGQ
jgi:carboxymethylenebutenolidase